MGQESAFRADLEEEVLAPASTSLLDATPLDRTPTGLAGLAAVPGLWRGDALARVALESLATGYAALDAELPGGGWPLGALTEILNGHTGIGELRLFFPALAKLARDGGQIILLQPPHQPYAPAFAGAGIAPEQVLVLRTRKPEDALWACEQCLKYAPRSAVFAWPKRLAQQDLRRLQLAVEGRPVLAVLMRERQAQQQSSAAALRISLQPALQPALQPKLQPALQTTPAPARAGQLSLRILKRRGALLTRPIVVEPPAPLPHPTPLVEEPHHAVDRPQPAATAA